MSRFYLIFFLFLFAPQLSAQVKLKSLIDFADKQYEKGDYYYALEYYKQALDRDSNSLELLWKYAETQRAYKNYIDAANYYGKVYARDEGLIYPECILNLALMEKQMGAYKNAFETMKAAKKFYLEDKTSYLYKKASKEVESIAWVLKHLNDSSNLDTTLIRLPENVNSNDSEFGHTVRDKRLLFSSLRADSINDVNEEVYSKTYKTKLYSSEIKNGIFEENKKINALESAQLNSGNGSFSRDGKRFYFSMCSDTGFAYSCKILVADYSNGDWSNIKPLDEVINEKGKNTTMPFIVEIEGEEVLFFASDRTGTKGGMDIWMTKVKNGVFTKPLNCGKINSPDNELSPWYDNATKRLYFSSSWHFGFGGQDIFYSDYKTEFLSPINLGQPINSPANDQYFFKYNDTTYLSSNRIGSFYSKNPTCCSDIYASFPIKKIVDKLEKFTEEEQETENELTKMISQPINLYFKNDEPDAKSWATETKQNYENTFYSYKNDFSLYINELDKNFEREDAIKKRSDLLNFFEEDVEKGFKDLNQFKDLTLKELEKGSKITVYLKGFASPLAKTDYNVNLTKRRISSILNYFNECNNGAFVRYLKDEAENGGKLIFSIVPFGEYTANQKTSDDYFDQKNSVYSKEAGIERKIEIQKLEIEKKNREFPLFCLEPTKDFSFVKKNQILESSFILKCISNEELQLKLINTDSSFSYKIEKSVADANTSYTLSFVYTPEQTEGFLFKSLFLTVDGFEEKLEFYITAEIIP